MPYAKTPDGVQLHYEESGEGQTIVFVHEFAGDHRSWEAQMRYFSRRYRCVAYSARGYTPSDIPSKGSMYSQDIARDDILAILDHLDVEKGHALFRARSLAGRRRLWVRCGT